MAALDSYHHGVRVVETDDGTRPIRTVSTAVVGFVATAEDADPITFPLNTPVLATNIAAAAGKMCIRDRINEPASPDCGRQPRNTPLPSSLYPCICLLYTSRCV